jgi:hypothetical protein
MWITQKAEFIWSDKQSKYLLVKRKSIFWTGPILLCKGASSQQTSLADSQQNFYNTLSSDYSTQFANQNSILSTLKNSLNPIISAGPNQFGYNAAETNNLNSQAIQGTGQQYANASKSLRANQAAQGGGNSLLPSGVSSQQQAGLASSAANQASGQLLGIQQSGYQQGHNDYESAIGQLGGVAGMYNPNGTASAANSAGSTANSEANAVSQANNAASPLSMLGGMAGSLMGGFGNLDTAGGSSLAEQGMNFLGGL